MKSPIIALLLLFGLGVSLQAQELEGSERRIYKTVGETELPLYIFKPDGHAADAKAPAIVFFFGGGWRKGNPDQFEEHCNYLAKRGMVAITVEYRVTSRHPVTVEDCIADAKSAMRWVRGNAAELGIDPNRIAAGGGSAGGHLAACTAVIEEFDAETDNLEISAKPNAMVLYNPFMGKSEGFQAGDSRVKVSPEKVVPLTFASVEQPPSIMFFGTEDALLEGAELFHEKSDAAGNSSKIVTYQGQGHGFFNAHRNEGKYYGLTIAETDQFLTELGWLEPN